MTSDLLPHEKGFVVSWDQLHRDCRALAWRLEGVQPEPGYWKRIIAITRGGMAPAMIVARELGIRTVDTISVESYDHKSQSDPKVVKNAVFGDMDGTLVIDDLVDTGKTLELVKSIFPTAHFATIYAKPLGRSFVDTYITEVSQDTWIYFPWDTALQYVGPYRQST